MTETEVELPAFESIQNALFPFMHDRVAGLHGWAADRSVTLLSENTSLKLSDITMLHVGAGFGGDMQEAYTHGIMRRRGLEKDLLQIRLAEFLHRARPDQLRDALMSDPVVRTLYSQVTIDEVVSGYIGERQQFDPDPLMILKCDVRNREQLSEIFRFAPAQYGKPNGLIGNIMMHWLVQGGFPLKIALNILGELLAPGGIAVFSVPFHFTELEDSSVDEHVRTQCMPDTRFYRTFTSIVTEKLAATFGEIPRQPFRKVPSLMLREKELKEGSDCLEFVTLSREWSNRTAPIHQVMAGFGTYESSLRAKAPAQQIAQYVAQAIEMTMEIVGTDETAGTFVTYYIFRRK